MIQRLLHRLLLRRHFWRYATFSEVAELYTSRMLRIFALRIISIFTSIYLYQEHFSLVFIALFWVAFYALKVLSSWPAALLIARLGPKHTTLITNIVSAVAMVFLPFAPEYGLWALIPWNILQAFSGATNDLAYMVDFSKVKNIQHAGKEIGYMNIIEKGATAISPLIGGGLAFLYGPAAIMILSAVLFLLSAVPLLMTPEPIPIRQHLKLRGFPWRTTWRSMRAESARGFDIVATGTGWSLFMAVIIFAGAGDDMYVKIGAVASVALVAALISSHIFGLLIDRNRGGELLRISAVFNAGLHAFRPFVATPMGVVVMNTINEAATTGYSMPFMRGLFDTADRSGSRIVYLAWIEVAQNCGAGIAALALAACFQFIEISASFSVFFIVSAIYTLLIVAPRFTLYRK